MREAESAIPSWVDNIIAIVNARKDRGVKFERYKGMSQDELGIWMASSDAKIAWFKDPDGNTLSITELG